MTDAEKIAQLEQKIADQDQRLVAQDQRLIAIEKNGAVSGEQGKQNAKEIHRVERQTTDQFKQLVNLMNEGFNRVETNLKNDIIRVEERINRMEERINRVETNLKNDIIRMEERINRVEGQMIKWLTLIVGVAVIIIGALTYLKG